MLAMAASPSSNSLVVSDVEGMSASPALICHQTIHRGSQWLLQINNAVMRS